MLVELARRAKLRTDKELPTLDVPNVEVAAASRILPCTLDELPTLRKALKLMFDANLELDMTDV
jgi:hypothetical protein